MKIVLFLLLASLLSAVSANTLHSFSTNYIKVYYDQTNGLFTAATGPKHPVGNGRSVLYGGDSGDPYTSYISIFSYQTNKTYTTAEYLESGIWMGKPVITSGTSSFVAQYRVLPAFEGGDDFSAAVTVTIVDDVDPNYSALVITTQISTDVEFSEQRFAVRYILDYQIDRDDGPTFRTQNPDSNRKLYETQYQNPQFQEYFMEPNYPVKHFYEIVATAAGNTKNQLLQPHGPLSLIQFTSWTENFRRPFDTYFNASLNIAVDPHYNQQNKGELDQTSIGDDSCVIVYWGLDSQHQIIVTTSAPQEISTSIFTFVRLADPFVGGSNETCDDGWACTWDYLNEIDCYDTECINIAIDQYCDDNDLCTVDKCDQTSLDFDQYGCIHVDIDCSDQIECTRDFCEDGVCKHENTTCDDGNTCTVDYCSSELGKCVNLPSDDLCAPTETDLCNLYFCDEFLGCTKRPIICNDDIECTNDTCNPLLGCTFTPLDSLCDDGINCTVDVCEPWVGRCGNYPMNSLCDDGDDCTSDFCDVAFGECTSVDVECKWGELACVRDYCIEGSCLFLAENDWCNDNNSCTVDTCDMSLSECTNIPHNDFCDDKLFCTDDYCDANSGCYHVPRDCDDQISCTFDYCDEETRQCMHSYELEALYCDDGINCTVDVCSRTLGRCHSYVNNSMCGPRSCAVGRCEPEFGGCTYTPMDCNDQIYCTEDICEDNACFNPVNHTKCNDGVDCTEDSCDGVLGCVNTPIDWLCDDNIECTDDFCNGTACVNYLNDWNCDDGIPCTIDVCTSNGCVHTANNSICDDQVDCTSDMCNEKLGCIFTPHDLFCEDSHACTVSTCHFDGCHTEYNDLVCSDGYECSEDKCTDNGCVPILHHDQCNDDVGCTDDECAYGVGCTHTANHVYCSDGRNCSVEMCDSTHGCIIEDALCPQDTREEHCINCASPRSRLAVQDFEDGTVDFRIQTRFEAVDPFYTASRHGLTNNMLIKNFGPVVFGEEHFLSSDSGVVIGADSGLKLVPSVHPLPPCNEINRGMMIVQSEENDNGDLVDTLFICLRDVDQYWWTPKDSPRSRDQI